MSGKQSKIRSRAKQRQKRASEKAARRAAYAAKIAAGRNEMKKTNSTPGQKKMRPRTHPYGRCGNIGCIKCSPQFAPGALGF